MNTTHEMMLTSQDIEAYTSSGAWQNRLLTDALDDAVQATPDHVASIDPRRTLTYRELAEEVDLAAHGLLAAGIEPGDVVSIQLPNWSEFVTLILAAHRVGAIANPLIPIYRDREIGHMASTAGTRIMFVAREFRGFDYAEMVDRLRPQLPDLREAVVISGDAPKGFTAWSDFLEQGRARREKEPLDAAALRPDPNSLALLMFTSGTTGKPKGVMHTHNTVMAGSLPWPDRLGMGPDTVVHMASTFGHLTGYLFGVSLPIVLGGTGVFQDVWDPEEFARLVEEHGIEHTSAATPFLADLLGVAEKTERDLSSLKRFACMGAPVPRSFITRAKELLPDLAVFGAWGQTEVCLVTMCHPDDPQEKLANTDGCALGQMEVRVVDLDGHGVDAGVEGRLQVRGPFVFRGYLGMLDKTREEFEGEWFDTGDLATMDEDGYIRLAGRTKDIIIRGGENIPVTYVENALYEHPDLEAVAVVAQEHERLQEIAVAVLVMKEGAEPLTLEALREFLQAKGVAKPYWPERVVVVDDFPRTPSGKIQKFKLRQQLVDAAG